MSSFYEYIVVGCGGIGSGAVYWLSKLVGNGVLGLEQFELGHVRGGSQDYSRIIRHLYHDEMYTKLTQATYDAWAEVEADSGIKVVHKCGSLDLAPKDAPEAQTVNLYAKALDEQGIKYEKLDGHGIRRYFPQWNIGAETVGIYQRDGGLVDAAVGNASHIQLARGNGATILDNCPVTDIRKLGPDNIQVSTTKGEFRCRRVIVTAGAWMNHVLGTCGVHIPITVTQEQVTYYGTPHMKEFTKDKFPVFLYHGDNHDIYGLPIHGNTGTKLGIDAAGNVVTADTRSWTPDPVRERRQVEFLQRYIPKYLGPVIESRTCLYAMTPDRNFVVDTLTKQGMPEVSFCCGAGHAYKFASLLGKILSEIAVNGRSSYDVSKFKMDRPAITDPSFPKTFVMGKVRPDAKAKL